MSFLRSIVPKKWVVSKPKLSVSTTNNTLGFTSILLNVWDNVLTSVLATVTHQHQQQSKRKREAEYLPYIIVDRYMKDYQLTLDSSIVTTVDRILASGEAEGREVATQLDKEYNDYCIHLRRCAGEQYFNVLAQNNINGVQTFFDDMTWNQLFINDAWVTYATGVRVVTEFPLIYNTVNYVKWKVHPESTKQKLSAAVTTDTSNQSLLVREVGILRQLTSTYWKQCEAAGRTNETWMRHNHVMIGDVIPKLNDIVTLLQECRKQVDKDPGFLHSNGITKRFASLCMGIIKEYSQYVEKMDVKNIKNLAAYYEETYHTGRKKDLVTPSIDVYLEEWDKHKSLQLCDQVSQVLYGKMDRCKEIAQQVEQLMATIDEKTMLNDMKKIIKELESDVALLGDISKQARLHILSYDRIPLMRLMDVAEAACIKHDAEEFSMNFASTMLSSLSTNERESQIKLREIMELNRTKFEEMKETGVGDGAYTTEQQHLKARMQKKMDEVRTALSEEMSTLFTNIDTWYIVYSKALISACESNAQLYMKHVVVPEEMVWMGITQIQNVSIDSVLREDVKKKIRPFIQQVQEFGDTIDDSPSTKVFPLIRRYVTSIQQQGSIQSWNLEGCWTLLDALYKVLQIINVDTKVTITV